LVYTGRKRIGRRKTIILEFIHKDHKENGMSNLSEVTRRKFLWLAGIGTASIGAFSLIPHAFATDSDDPLAIAQEAYIWGLPAVCIRWYFEWARQNNIPLNRFTGNPNLSLPADKAVGPCMNLLYGFAFLDVANEPLVLHVPETNDRYYSVQLIDEYSNDFSYVGRRATGTKEGKYLIVGPRWKGKVPAGLTKIESLTSRILVLTRTLVKGDDDLPAAQAIQKQYALSPLSAYPRILSEELYFLQTIPIPDFSTLGLQFFDQLSAALATLPILPQDAAALRRFEKVGIKAGVHPSQVVDPALRAALIKAVPAANTQIVKADVTDNTNGWSVNYKVTNFIKDPLLKASANLYGPGTHVAQEALYFIGKPDEPLTGANKYTLKFAAGALPPVNAFWSLSAYEGTQFLLIPNPIDRYAIGTVTAGLNPNDDGSLELQLQEEAPEKGTSNWLPISSGPFHLVLRMYQPRPELIDGTYKVPALHKV
jgi:hypothetical protein